MRAIVLALFVVALANPQQVMHSEGAARPAIVDASASITPAMRAWTLKLLRDDLGLRAGDPAYMFASDAAPQSIGARRIGVRQRRRMRRMRAGRDQSRRRALSNRRRSRRARRPGRDGDRRMAESRRRRARDKRDRQRRDSPRHLHAARRAIDSQRRDDGALAAARAREGRAVRARRHDGKSQRRAGDRHDRNRARRRADRSAQSDAARAARSASTSRCAPKPPASLRTPRPSSPTIPRSTRISRTTRCKGWVGVGTRRKVLILTDSAKDANYLGTVVNRMGLDPTVVPVTGGDVGRHRRRLRRGADQQRAERAHRAGGAECDGGVRRAAAVRSR